MNSRMLQMSARDIVYSCYMLNSMVEILQDAESGKAAEMDKKLETYTNRFQQFIYN